MFTVLDIETTGLSPKNSKIIEIYAHSFGSKKETEFHSLINPDRPIPRAIQKLTGIDNSMVLHEPKIETVMPAFDKFLNTNDVIVGHNVGFDIRFLDHFNQEINSKPIHNDSLCTLRLARRLFYEKPMVNMKLNTMCDYYGIDMDGHHRAKCDTLATKELFNCIKDDFENIGFELNDLFTLQATPCKRAARLINEQK